MTARPGPRLGIILLAALLPALILGAALFLRDATAALSPSPAPNSPIARAILSPTPLPATPTASPATSPTVPTVRPAAPVSSPPATPMAIPVATATPTPPAPVWVTVGQWHDHDVVYTPAFTVSGPWRIRWRLSAPTEIFQVMIEEGQATPVLISGATGATAGVIDNPRGGTYSLMLHNTIPYDVIVEELRTP